MAGVYIHIPFCKKICHYCDFFRTKSIQRIPDFVNALLIELKLQEKYLIGENIETIYFGGGTPSLLEINYVSKILNQIYLLFPVINKPEITIEANPDDITKEYLSELKQLPINRISLGIQSFHDDELKLMNRRHSAKQAIEAVKLLQDFGFNNISIDIIFGLPNSNVERLTENIQQAVQLNVNHISAYDLTIEPNTIFHKWVKEKKISRVGEEQSFLQFKTLIGLLEQNGYQHYEISNFAKPDCYSKHNTNYWKQKPYLGVGPSAHSFNGQSRQWNIKNLDKYIDSIHQNVIPFEIEYLNPTTKLNEFIMTSLRTMWGLDLNEVERLYDVSIKNRLLENASKYIKSNHLIYSNSTLILSTEGKFISDSIISELFF